MPWRIRYRRHYEEYSDFTAEKYNSPDYIKVGEGIYGHDGEFFCSLSFVQEPQYGEGDSASNIAGILWRIFWTSIMRMWRISTRV